MALLHPNPKMNWLSDRAKNDENGVTHEQLINKLNEVTIQENTFGKFGYTLDPLKFGKLSDICIFFLNIKFFLTLIIREETLNIEMLMWCSKIGSEYYEIMFYLRTSFLTKHRYQPFQHFVQVQCVFSYTVRHV